MSFDVTTRYMFLTVLRAYDLASHRLGKHVEQQQRSIDLFEIITEFNRQNEERLMRIREQRRIAHASKQRHIEISD